MKMPKPDKAVIDKRDRIAADLIDLIGKEGAVAEEAAMSPFDPMASMPTARHFWWSLPLTRGGSRQRAPLLSGQQLKIVPRGAGTSLGRCRLPMVCCWAQPHEPHP